SSVYVRGLALGHQLIHDDVPGILVKSVPDDGLVIYDHLYGMVLGFLNPNGNLDFYHLLNLLVALPLFIVLFEMLLASTGNPWAAALGPVFLFLTPRFTGDIPGNPKDIPFSTAYFLAWRVFTPFYPASPQRPPSPRRSFWDFFSSSPNAPAPLVFPSTWSSCSMTFTSFTTGENPLE